MNPPTVPGAGAPVDFHVVVPARLASTRLPDKPLADLEGEPMVVRVARRALASGAASVTVATDAEPIAEAVRRAGLRTILTAADHPSGTDRIAEAVDALRLPDDAVVVNLQGDEPLMPPALLARVAAALAADPQAAIATAAHPIEGLDAFRNPNVVKVVLDARGGALLFSRAPVPWPRDAVDSVPPGALRHVGLYAYRAGFLRAWPALARSPIEQIESLEQLRALWHGHRITVLVVDEAPPAGVDTPEDLKRVRALLRRTGR